MTTIKYRHGVWMLLASSSLLGAAAAFARTYLLSVCVDMETGLFFIGGQSKFNILYICLAAAILVFFLLARLTAKRREDDGYTLSAASKTVTAACSAALLLAAAALTGFRGAFSFAGLIDAVFLLVCAVCACAAIRKERHTGVFCALVPIFYVGFALLVFYRANSMNTLVYSFALETLGGVALLLALYRRAALMLSRGGSASALFFTSAATFGVVAMATSYLLLPAYFATFSTLSLPNGLAAFAFLLPLWSRLLDRPCGDPTGEDDRENSDDTDAALSDDSDTWFLAQDAADDRPQASEPESGDGEV